MAVDMAAMAMAGTAVATMARGLLMPSPRLMLRPSRVMVMAVAMAAMAATGVATTATAKGLLSPAMATAMAGATVAMAATATAGATATGVSYHRIRRSELSQKQKHKNSQR